MLGKIFIKDLLVRCHIGINDQEKQEPQDILVNVEITADIASSIAYDDLNKTVNYRPVYKHILELAKTSRFNLIETLGDNIADFAMRFNPIVKSVNVKIEKTHRFDFLQSVGIEITHAR